MRPKTKNLLGVLVVVLIAWISIGGFVLYAINKVRTGHGLDYYFTGEGVQMNYIGVLIAFAVAAVAVLVGLIIRFWSRRGDIWSGKGLKINKKAKT
jgi:hypothetical protein